MKKVAVYGSLLSGLGNNIILKDSLKLGEEVISIPFKMVSLGAYPGLIPTEDNNNIKIEIYEVSDELFTNKLDRLEGYPDFYNRMEVNTSFGKAWIYFLNDYSFIDNYSLQIVFSGDWKTYLKTYEKNNKVLS